MRRGCHRRDECAPASRCSGASGLATRRLLRPSSDLPSGARTARVRSASFVRGLCVMYRFMYRGREHVPLTCSFFDILICHLARAPTFGRAPARKCARGEATSHVTALFDTSTLVYAYAGYAACYADTRVVTRHPPPAGRPPVGRTTARSPPSPGFHWTTLDTAVGLFYRREIPLTCSIADTRYAMSSRALGSECL